MKKTNEKKCYFDKSLGVMVHRYDVPLRDDLAIECQCGLAVTVRQSTKPSSDRKKNGGNFATFKRKTMEENKHNNIG